MISRINRIKRISEEIRSRYPMSKLNFFYDLQNMRFYDAIIKRSEDRIISTICIFCNKNEETDLYVRIHAYKGWIIMRISREGELSVDEKKKLENLSILSIIEYQEHDYGIVVKLAL